MAHTYSYRSTGFDAAPSTGSSRNPRSSRTGKAQVRHDGEKHELNTLNDRFGSYLEKIKSLAQINASLRRQVDDAYRKYIGHTDGLTEQIYQHPSERQLSQLRQQINEEVRAQTLIQIRLQRADYDVKFYRTHLQLLSAHDQQQSEQIRTMRQQLDVNLRALKQLQDEYHRREQDLKETHSQYAEYMNKLIEFANQYDTVTYERMINENELYTLKERIAFEQEYHQRRQEEVSYLEQIQVDVNKQFKQNEFQQIIQRIRSDYQEFNAIRLEELEGAYKTKLETVRHEVRQRNEQEQQTKKPTEVRQVLDSTKKEHQTLIEQNRSLKGKLEQLETDLHGIIEQNRQGYEKIDREYRQMQSEIPELDCLIVHLRENAGSLWSEINTYRYLLFNLLSTKNDEPPAVVPTRPPKVKKATSPVILTNGQSAGKQYRDETTGFIVHIEDGIIWVRI